MRAPFSPIRARLRRRSTSDLRRGVIVGDGTRAVSARTDGGGMLIPATELAVALGAELVEGGLQRGGMRVEVAPDDDGMVDPRPMAQAFGIPVAVELSTDPIVVAVGRPAEEWPLRDSLGAPDVELEDLDGRAVRLSEWCGQRRVLLAFASWCGCRDDLPAWQEVIDSLPGPHEIDLVAIAIDEHLEEVRELAASVRLPVLIDRDRRFCDAYGVIHVPTVIWVDERDQLVRPNEVVFADSRLEQFHGIDHRPHHEQLLRWSEAGVLPFDSDGVTAAQMHPTDHEQAARTEFRLALWLLREGEEVAGRAHLDEAERLSPEDLTIRRAAIKLRGGDPLGEDFVPVYEHWKQVSEGRYYRPRQH